MVQSAAMRLIVVPRWAGGPLSDWYPWLAGELSTTFDEIVVMRMPRPERAAIEPWVETLTEAVGDPETLSRTCFAGHSVGNQAVLRYLARQPHGTRCKGLLAVAGWWHIDEPWETLLPWLEHDWDVPRARAALERSEVLISDDDPFTRDAAANRREWENRVGAHVTVVSGARHFNDKQAPVVRDILLGMIANESNHDLTR